MNEQQRQEIANFRYGLIAPLVHRTLGPREQAALLRETSSHLYDIPGCNHPKSVSVRTLERYLQLYRANGWEALKPHPRADKLQSRRITDDVLTKAIALKEENPLRSVRQIIAILELARLVDPGTLKESTLSKQLRKLGKTRQQLQQTEQEQYRRFEATGRNACWQGDVQHTLYLPHPEKPGKKKMAYLVVFLDDYSRYVVHGQFYFEERVPRLEDCLKKAILKHGIPEMIYVDNGAIYSSHQFKRICGRLRTMLKHTRPGRPQGRGKQEKFFRFVDQSFVPEAYDLIEQGKITNLEDLNRFFAAWLEIAYHQKVHNSFKQRPLDRYRQDDTEIRTIPPHELFEVFLLEESRKVDKTGCISLLGTTYEVDASLAGQTIQVRFDPYDLEEVQVWKEDEKLQHAKALRLRDMSFEKKEERPADPIPTTGLNYAELVAQEFDRQQTERHTQAMQEILQQGVKNT